MDTRLAFQAVGTTQFGPGPKQAYTVVHELTVLYG